MIIRSYQFGDPLIALSIATRDFFARGTIVHESFRGIVEIQLPTVFGRFGWSSFWFIDEMNAQQTPEQILWQFQNNEVTNNIRVEHELVIVLNMLLRNEPNRSCLKSLGASCSF